MDRGLAERVIEGDGTPESVWQSWPGLARLRSVQIDHWISADARLVVVAPHPDDEVLSCGAMLALHAAQGGASFVVAVTDGEASHAGCSQWAPDRLAAARRAESLEGLNRLGVPSANVIRLGLSDGCVDRHADRLVLELGSLLRAGDVVVSTWRLDGHPDHEATGRATARACAAPGCRLLEAPVWMWHWAVPGDSRVPWHRLRGLPIPPQARTRKRHALAAHATQLSARDSGEGPVLGAGVRDRLSREIEHFFV